MIKIKTNTITDSDKLILLSVHHLWFLVGCTSRLAYAVLMGGSLLLANLIAGLTASLTAELLPSRGKDFIGLLLATVSAGLVYSIALLIAPVLVEELELYFFLIPVSIISSRLPRRCQSISLAQSGFLILGEIGLVITLLSAMAIVREPLGFGTLSLPGREALVVLLASKSESSGIQVITTSAGALIMIGFLIAGIVRIQRRLSRRSPYQDL